MELFQFVERLLQRIFGEVIHEPLFEDGKWDQSGDRFLITRHQNRHLIPLEGVQDGSQRPANCERIDGFHVCMIVGLPVCLVNFRHRMFIGHSPAATPAFVSARKTLWERRVYNRAPGDIL